MKQEYKHFVEEEKVDRSNRTPRNRIDEDKKKTKLFTVKLSIEEYENLEKLSDDAKLSKAQFVREKTGI